jgi:hypothetical protein
MASDFDPADFVDSDFQAHKTPQTATSMLGASPAFRAPTREEVDSKVAEAQQKLSELKRAQEDLERERATLEETRRRQAEFQTGRQEVINNLTRGVGLLEEAEFTARRDAEQMAKALADFRGALNKVESVREENWTRDNFNVELTRALTAVENARMEWNAARLKFPVLSGQVLNGNESTAPARREETAVFPNQSFGQWCKLGFALTWPLALIALGVLGVLLAILLQPR